MNSLVFDTHAFVKRLTGAGMPIEQPEILAEEQARLVDERLATKIDLELLKRDLTIRIGGMVVIATGILFGGEVLRLIAAGSPRP